MTSFIEKWLVVALCLGNLVPCVLFCKEQPAWSVFTGLTLVLVAMHVMRTNKKERIILERIKLLKQKLL